MKAIFCTLCLLFYIFAYGDCGGFGNLKNEDMRDCHFHRICDLNLVEECADISEQGSPKIKRLMWEWLEEAYGTKGPNTVENWSKYRDVACALTDEKRQERFNLFFQLGSEWWLKACMNVLSTDCKDGEKAAFLLSGYFEERMEKGDCVRSN